MTRDMAHRIPHAHPERLSRKRLIGECVAFVLGLAVIVAAMSLVPV